MCVLLVWWGCLCDNNNNNNNNLLEYCIVMQWSVMSTRHCLYLVSNIGGLLLSSLSSPSDFLTQSESREGRGGGGAGGGINLLMR